MNDLPKESKGKGAPRQHVDPKTMLTCILLAIFAVGAGGFAALHLWGPLEQHWTRELSQALLQLGVVSVAAAVISILVFSYQEWRKGQESARDRLLAGQQNRMAILKAMITRLNAAYNVVKRTRRALASVGNRQTAEEDKFVLPALDTCMSDLNGAQLEFESIVSDVKTNCEDYDSARDLLTNLGALEGYLRKITMEYQAVRSKMRSGATGLAAKDMPKAKEFIRPSKEGSFFQFKTHYGKAREAVWRDIQSLRAVIEGPEAAAKSKRKNLNGNGQAIVPAPVPGLAEGAAP